MADFCLQCSEDMFGRKENDFKDFKSKKDNEEGLYEMVLCEGCGFIQVDYEGRCISDDCLEKHGKEKINV